jgi:NitT/TauT family transport system ATP-binding protein
VHDVGLPRPRDVEELRITTAFIDVYRDIWKSLSAEVDIARKVPSRVA